MYLFSVIIAVFSRYCVAIHDCNEIPFFAHCLTKNYYLQIIIFKSFAKITNLTCNSLKSLSFPEILRAQNPWKITENNSQGRVFFVVTFSCQRLRRAWSEEAEGWRPVRSQESQFLHCRTCYVGNIQKSAVLQGKVLAAPCGNQLLKHRIHVKNSGKLIFGSLHHSHVIHCASRTCTWKTLFVCNGGAGPCMWEFWGTILCGHYIYFM